MKDEWIDVKDRLPTTEGEYVVYRRSMGGRPGYEDVCHFTPPDTWMNRLGTVIQTVEKWKE